MSDIFDFNKKPIWVSKRTYNFSICKTPYYLVEISICDRIFDGGSYRFDTITYGNKERLLGEMFYARAKKLKSLKEVEKLFQELTGHISDVYIEHKGNGYYSSRWGWLISESKKRV